MSYGYRKNQSKICDLTQRRHSSFKLHVQWGQPGVLLIVVIHRLWQMDVLA